MYDKGQTLSNARMNGNDMLHSYMGRKKQPGGNMKALNKCALQHQKAMRKMEMIYTKAERK